MKHLLVIALALLLSACNTLPQELQDLDKTLRAYEHSIRWSRLELATKYFKEPPEFSRRDKERLKNIQVTGYKVMTTNAAKDEAVQVVEIRYFNTNSAIERTITDTQKWEYDKEAERWALVSEFPDFR